MGDLERYRRRRFQLEWDVHVRLRREHSDWDYRMISLVVDSEVRRIMDER